VVVEMALKLLGAKRSQQSAGLIEMTPSRRAALAESKPGLMSTAHEAQQPRSFERNARRFSSQCEQAEWGLATKPQHSFAYSLRCLDCGTKFFDVTRPNDRIRPLRCPFCGRSHYEAWREQITEPCGPWDEVPLFQQGYLCADEWVPAPEVAYDEGGVKLSKYTTGEPGTPPVSNS
jgi:DNA-directed RNA polymerase subunit RPC12/RpoP